MGGDVSAQDPVPEAGDKIGEYLVRGLIAVGPTAAFLDVEHVSAGRRSALVLRFAPGSEALEREARLLAGLTHPNLVEVQGSGVADDGRVYVIMERAGAAPTLRQHLHARGRLSAADAVRVASGVVAGLLAMREHGIVSCGVSADDVFLSESSLTPRIACFGTAPAEADGGDVRAVGLLLRDMAPAGSRKLDAIVARCLDPLRAQRFSSLSALRNALLARDQSAATLPEQASGYAELAAGDCVDDKYRIEAFRGRGGFGTVYRATQLEVERRVALKVLHPDLSRFIASVLRFRREAQALGRVEHPGVVTVYDAGTLDDGRCYIAMEWLEGETLAEWLATHGPMPAERALPLLTSVCEAVDAAHRAGVVHRDIKPANIHLDDRSPSGVKLVDFGIANFLAPGEEAGESREIAGTPAVMAPEQAAGSAVDARADVYALGVTLFWLLCGDPPDRPDWVQRDPARWEAEMVALLGQRQVPAPLIAVVLRCLRADPASRFQSAAELSAALRQVGERGRRRRRRLLAALGAAALVAAALGLLLAGGAGRGVGDDGVDPGSSAGGAAGPSGGRKLDPVEAGREALLGGRPGQALEILAAAHAGGSSHPDLPVLLAAALATLAPLQFTLPGDRPVTAVELSDDAATLALAREGGAVELWDLRARRLLHRLDQAGPPVLALSPDGALLAVGGAGGLSLVSVTTGRSLAQLLRVRPIFSAWSEDGSRLVTVAVDGELQIWQKDGAPLCALRASTLPGRVMLAPGGTLVAVDREENPARSVVHVIDTGKAAELRSFALDGHFRPAAIDRHGRRLALAAEGKRGLRLLDLESGAPQDLPEHIAPVFGPEGELFAVDREGLPERWEPGAAESHQRLQESAQRLLVSPSGALLAVTGPLGATTLFDARDGRFRAQLAHRGRPSHLLFSRDEKLLLAAAEDGSVEVWDGSADALLGSLDTHGTRSVEMLDDSRIFSIGDDFVIHVWNGKTFTRIRTVGKGMLGLSDDRRFISTGNEVWGLTGDEPVARLDNPVPDPTATALNADGTLAVTGNFYGDIRLWNPRTGASIATLKDRAWTPMASFSFSFDGKRLAAAHAFEGLRVWNLGNPSAVLPELAGGPFRQVSFAKNGLLLAIGRGEVLVYDPARVAAINEYGEGRLYYAHWMEGGKTMLTVDASLDSQLVVRDGRTLNDRRVMRAGRTVSVNTAQSPDDQVVVAGGSEGTLLVFSAASGELLVRRAAGSGPMSAVAIDPGRRVVATAMGDRILLWALPQNRLSAAEVAAFRAAHGR